MGGKTVNEHKEITTLKVRAAVHFVEKEGAVIAEKLGDGCNVLFLDLKGCYKL